MTLIFTVCSNNYIAQASLLARSLYDKSRDFKFIAILVDVFSDEIDYSAFSFKIIPIKEVEPDILTLSEKYNVVELNTCFKPRGFEYFFENYEYTRVIYVDSDIFFYDSVEWFEALFDTADILLTPHIISPAPHDGRTPDDNVFLNYGLYNGGFIGVKKSEESLRFVRWWKSHTYNNCFDNVAAGTFVDQLYINLVPIFFKNVHIIRDAGCNMGPWNLHERRLTIENGIFLVNNQDTLKFFHFGTFKLNAYELPVHFYNRYSLRDRGDVRELYLAYNELLSAANHQFFQSVSCIYYDYHLETKLAKIEIAEQEKWNNKPLLKRIFLVVVPKAVFRYLQAALQKIINAYPYSDYR